MDRGLMEPRRLYIDIWHELIEDKPMVFMAGPRQSGKTTLGRIISREWTNSLYFNWDIPDDKKRLIESPFFFQDIERKDLSTPFVVFDEIHKYKDWKNYLKGVYDSFHHEYAFLVSGSGRLDIYRKGADSLAGRYLLFHLWPFTLAELAEKRYELEYFLAHPLTIVEKEKTACKNIWQQLFRVSGFPEPFLSGRERSYRRWSNMYSSQIIREDIRDIAAIKSISDIETLYYLLSDRIGSPISITSLSNVLKTSYNTVHNWLQLFERFFLTLSIGTWTGKISRSIQKERKLYLWDSPRIRDASARFENMAALELRRATCTWNELGYGNFSLHFIKDKEKNEVDFLVARDRNPWLLVETKLSQMSPGKSLLRFQNSLSVPAVQLVNEGNAIKKIKNNGNELLITPAWLWLPLLP